MKRLITTLTISTLLIFILAGFGAQQSTAAEPITLKLSDHWPVGHYHNIGAELFVKRAEELSNGRLKVAHYPAMQLNNIQDMLPTVSSGVADIAVVPPTLYGGKLPLHGVMMLPLYTTAVEGMEIYQRLIKAAPELQQEFAKYGTRILTGFPTNQYDVGTVDTPVRSPEDLKGLKLSSSGAWMHAIARKYGINSVTIGGLEMYEATQRGIVKGNILSIPSVWGYRLYELQKYQTYGLRMGAAVLVYAMNEKSWQKLPEDLQKILLQAAHEGAVKSVELWDEGVQKNLAEFRKAGVEIYTVKPEERAKWDAPLKGIEQEWINDINKKDLPGQKVFDAFYKICQEVAK